MNTNLPMQPVHKDADGVIRFVGNKVVEYLLDNGGLDMNKLAMADLPRRDREQFAQLIGYSVCGYHELDYVSDASALAASEAARKINPKAGGCRDGGGCSVHSGVAEDEP